MNFKNFIYYCALCGAWAALFAWLIAEVMGQNEASTSDREAIMKSATVAAILGLLLASVIGFLDALMNATGFQRIVRVFVCLLVGLVGSLAGGALGETLATYVLGQFVGRIIGWIVVGVIIGGSLGVFDLLRAMAAGKGKGQAVRKIVNGVIGGTLGGALGGTLTAMIGQTPIRETLPRFVLATGLVILGACIGLLIGLAQVILKEAWVKVEQGFKAGRQMILSKPDTTIGRAEGSDIALFGDQQCEKLHAHIVLKGDRYVLVEHGSPGTGTFINDQRISGQAPLKSGDLIRVGKSLLRFEERAKRK